MVGVCWSPLGTVAFCLQQSVRRPTQPTLTTWTDRLKSETKLYRYSRCLFLSDILSLSLRIQCKSVWKHTLAVKVAIHVWKHCGCVKLVRTRKWQVPYSSCTTGRNPAVCLYMTWNKVVKSLTYRFWNIGQSLWQPPPLCRTIALPLTTSRRSIFWFFDSKRIWRVRKWVSTLHRFRTDLPGGHAPPLGLQQGRLSLKRLKRCTNRVGISIYWLQSCWVHLAHPLLAVTTWQLDRCDWYDTPTKTVW